MEGDHPLKSYREREGITKAELAGRLGVSRAAITRYENRDRKIEPDLVSKVSEITGIPPGDLRPDLAKLFPQPEAAE